MGPYFQTVIKVFLARVRLEVCIDGEIVPLDRKGACKFEVKLKIRSRLIKIKRPPQPNRRKKKKTRRK